jgi:DNA invertase Pin-like site-specific DNA recombinase
MRVLGYARTSTKKQNIDLQEAQIRDYCQDRGFDLVAMYSDFGVSGRAYVRNRPKGKQVLEALARGDGDRIVVTWSDRWTRSIDDPDGLLYGGSLFIVINGEQEAQTRMKLKDMFIAALRADGWTVEPP